MAEDTVKHQFALPRPVGMGTSNAMYTVPGTRRVQRWPHGEIDALDFRVTTDLDVRRALRVHEPQEFGSSSAGHAEPLDDTLDMDRLDPHEHDATSAEWHDWHLRFLISELGHLSKHSEKAAEALAPQARQVVQRMTELDERDVPLRCGPDDGDCARYRAFTLRVATVATTILGGEVSAQFGLPTPTELDGQLRQPYQDTSPLVLAHGDPTVSNFMWSFGEPVLIDFDLARPMGRTSAAGHTLAALVTRSPRALSRERINQFVEEVDGTREALASGVYDTYYQYEVARSGYVDVLRGLLGQAPPRLVYRNLRRLLDSDEQLAAQAPSWDRFQQLLRDIPKDAVFLPVLPHQVCDLLAVRRQGTDPVHQWEFVQALRDEVTGATRAAMPPEARAAYDRMRALVPPGEGSLALMAEQLKQEGRTHVLRTETPDRVRVTFTRPPAPGAAPSAPGSRHDDGPTRGKGLERS